MGCEKKCKKNLHISKKSCNFAQNFKDMDGRMTELREIVNTSARNLTKAQIERVREIAGELGISLPSKKSCKSCWIDTAVLCYRALDDTTAADEGTDSTDGRRYVLKPNVDLLFGGKRINAATMTDELAERILARGFETKYFVRYASNG